MSDYEAISTTAANEDAVSKYKKLLTVARQSLEANQKKLAEKDRALEQLNGQVEQLSRQKEQLKQALEGEVSRNRNGLQVDEESLSKPRRILRRVDVGEKIWLLFEYSDATSAWVSFGSSQESSDFITRLSGEPLQIPHKSFTPEESSNLVTFYMFFT